jgi:hypothetical protein
LPIFTPVSVIFGYDSPKITGPQLNAWFQREGLTTLSTEPDLAPELIVFLQEQKMLMHCDETYNICACGEFRLATHASTLTEHGDAIASEGWQLEIMLALLYKACLERGIEMTDPGTWAPRIRAELNELSQMLTFAGAVPSADFFQLGRGHTPAPG